MLLQNTVSRRYELKLGNYMYNIGFKVRITTVNAILRNYIHIAEHSGKADCVSDVCFTCAPLICTATVIDVYLYKN